MTENNKKENPDFITVTRGMSGYFVVYMSYYEDMQGYDIWQTGLGRYKTHKEAEDEAVWWAKDEGIEFRS